jgi:hypothetical protein
MQEINLISLAVAFNVARLGKISPLGRNFAALGAFFTAQYRPMIWVHFLQKIAQNAPK